MNTYISEDQCNDCGPNTKCIYDSDAMVFKCVCETGYTRAGRNCIRQRTLLITSSVFVITIR